MSIDCLPLIDSSRRGGYLSSLIVGGSLIHHDQSDLWLGGVPNPRVLPAEPPMIVDQSRSGWSDRLLVSSHDFLRRVSPRTTFRKWLSDQTLERLSTYQAVKNELCATCTPVQGEPPKRRGRRDMVVRVLPPVISSYLH